MTNRTLRALAFAAAVTVVVAVTGACATPAPPPAEPAPTPSVEALPAPAADARCWETEEQITLATGATQPGARRVLRMTAEPEAGRVVHEALRFDPNPQVPPRLFTVVWQVEGDAFTLSDEESRISGSGTLEGEPWSWTGWSAESRLGSGIRLLEKATIGADGALLLERQVFGPDGGAVMTIREEGRPLAPEECARRLAEVTSVAVR
jgi:hypothetical protein